MSKQSYQLSMTAQEIDQTLLNMSAKLTQINFANLTTNNKFTETVNGETVEHTIQFDGQGRPTKIDDIEIVW